MLGLGWMAVAQARRADATCPRSQSESGTVGIPTVYGALQSLLCRCHRGSWHFLPPFFPRCCEPRPSSSSLSVLCLSSVHILYLVKFSLFSGLLPLSFVKDALTLPDRFSFILSIHPSTIIHHLPSILFSHNLCQRDFWLSRSFVAASSVIHGPLPAAKHHHRTEPVGPPAWELAKGKSGPDAFCPWCCLTRRLLPVPLTLPLLLHRKILTFGLFLKERISMSGVTSS